MKITLLDQPIASLLSSQTKVIFSYPEEKIWNPKGVSLKNRIKTNPSLKNRITKALKPANIRKYIVATDLEAPTRCIDGRIRKGWKSLDQKAIENLGPKVAGGTAHAALAHRIVDADSLKEDLQFEHDLQFVIKRFKELGIAIGGHIDGHAKGNDTGCGAIDNINLILERMQVPEPQEQLRGLTHILLGDAYDGRGIANEVIGRMLYLDALKPKYMPKKNDNPTGEFLYKQVVMKMLRAAADDTHDAVPELEGPHNEVAVVLNFVEGTTFDTDRFSADNQNEIQVFGWDIWEMYQEAERLYPYDMYENTAVQRTAIEKRMKYVTTRTLLGIATTMVLTDGSIRVLTVKP